MQKLGFVLVLATLGALSAWALASTKRGARRDDEGGVIARLAIGGSSIAFAWALLRFFRTDLAQASGRATWAIAGLAIGLAAACVAGALRARWTPREDAPADAAARLGGASAILALSVATAGLALSVAIALRLGGPSAVPRVAAGYALGSALAALALAGSGDVFVVASAFGAATTATASAVAVRNDTFLRASGLDPAALLALPLVLLAFGAHATTIGVMAIRSDPEEPPDAARLRGFFVASLVTLAGVATAAQWWGRPPGHGAWLSLAALVGGVAAFLALLLGRYYDDPEHRPHRAIVRAIAVGGRARAFTATAIGLEGAAALALVAGLAAFAAYRCGELLGLEGGGILAIAIAGAAVVASSGYLAALSAASGEAHGALAHDVVALGIASGLVVHAIDGGRVGAADAASAAALSGLLIGVFLALQLQGVQRAAAVVLVLPVVFAALRGRHGLALATSLATGVGLVLATVFERAALTHEGDTRFRAIAGALPTLVAGTAACAATASGVLS
ncbi:MAG: sodium/proton-translocating pyrophosphatase [Polyangiales bacterium]